MRKTVAISTILMCAAGTVQGQTVGSEQAAKIQTQIETVEKQIKANPCFSPTGTSKFCQHKDNIKFESLQTQKRKLEDEKRATQTKTSAQTTAPPREPGFLAGGTTSNFVGAMIFLIVTAAAALIVILWLLLRNRQTTGYSDSHGSAAWASDAELNEWQFIQKAAEVEPGELAIARHNDKTKEIIVLPELIAARHNGVVGPSGTGKSRKIFLPNLFFLANKVSMFVHDTSGELWKLTSGYWTSVARFAPHEPEQSRCLNWVPLCGDQNALETLIYAETIVTNGDSNHSKDKFWDRTATALLAGVFAHAATTETPTPAFAYDLITNLELEELERVLIGSPSRFAREEGMKIKRADDKTRKNILSGLSSCLDFMRDERIRRFTSGTTKAPDFTQMRRENIAAFWCIPDTLAEVLRPLTCLAVRVMMSQLKETDGNHCYLMLDEFDTLGRIPKFESDITLLRKRKVIIVAGVQLLSQLTKNYGRESAEIILEGLQSIVVLSGLKGKIAKEISEWLGEFTLIEDSVSVSNNHGLLQGGSTSTSERKHARRLMTADELRRIDDNEVLILTTNKKPFLKPSFWFNQPTQPHRIEVKAVKAIAQGIVKESADAERTAQPKKKTPPPKFPDEPEFEM